MLAPRLVKPVIDTRPSGRPVPGKNWSTEVEPFGAAFVVGREKLTHAEDDFICGIYRIARGESYIAT